MPRQTALLLCIAFISWLFWRDRKDRPMTSWGLWLPFVWIVILGSRPVSTWFGAGVAIDDPSKYLDGSPVDRAVFLSLIIAGMVVLAGRKIDWGGIIASNRWLFAFLFYCLASVLWSDYPFVGFKRWTKELGNLIMIMILFTESDPARAAKAVLARFTYLAVPLSVVFIKYFPDIGRYYSNYTWIVGYGGITTNKNTLGAVLVVCGLFLLWDWIGRRGEARAGRDRVRIAADLLVFLMLLWLLTIAESMTAVLCFILGASVLFLMRHPWGRRQVRHAGSYALAMVLLVALFYSIPAITTSVAELLGRDTTLTGRTELWSDLIRMPVNRVFGTGYQGFWLGTRAEEMWAKYHFRPTQAHNGYLETYLNLGLVGLSLLVATVVSAGKKLKTQVLAENSFGIFRFSLLLIVLLYNWTEAIFNGMNPLWITMLISAFAHARPAHSLAEQASPGTPGAASPWSTRQEAVRLHEKTGQA